MGLVPGSRLGPYRILSVVGSGGMGEVYRARDEKLDREVAIKVLPQAVAGDPEALARFEREAKAVAALSHQNILTIHDFGTDGGVTYAVMELLEGETLRSRILAGRIPQKEAIDYSLQIVRGLAAAHDRGVVHRDIKPENVFVSKGGQLKILDFGLARREKRVAPGDQTSAPTASVDTKPGTVMGTAGYMSPEQVVGEIVDARSDIFSFGAVLYEMLSGRKPFSRPTIGQTIAAILRDEPPDLSESDRSISAQLDHVVRHCLEKDRDRRFQSAHDVAFALSEASGPATPAGTPSRFARTSRIIGLAALLVVLAVAALVLRRPSRSDARIKRVAVLPFENLGAPQDDYFVDGMADAVRGKLTSLRGIEVIARGSSVGYKKTSKSPKQIADELGAPYLLMATVRWQKGGDNSRVQVSPELVQVKDSGAPASRWQQPFDAALTDVFQVQADIATRVAESLDVVLAAADEQQLSKKPTQNLDAYDAYLKGLENENRFYFKEARAAFTKAHELDPNFAMATLGLARQSRDEVERLMLVKRAASDTRRLNELERLHVEMALAVEERRFDDAIRTASEIHQKFPSDPRSAQYLAFRELSSGNSDRAIKIFEELLAIDPKNEEAYNQIGYYYGYRGDYDKAIETFNRYRLIAPDTANPYDSLGEVQAYSGHYNEALENLNHALAIKPDFVESIAHLAVVYEGLGEYSKAIAAYEKAADVVDDPTRRRDFAARAVIAAFSARNMPEVLRLCTKAKGIKWDSKYAAISAGYLDATSALADGRPAEAQKIVMALQPKLDAIAAAEKLPALRRSFYPVTNLLMALALEGQGKNPEALEYWKTNAFPPNPFLNFEDRRWIYEARAKVAVGLARAGDLEGAEKLLAENRKWNPSWAPTRPDELEVERLRRQKKQGAAR